MRYDTPKPPCPRPPRLHLRPVRRCRRPCESQSASDLSHYVATCHKGDITVLRPDAQELLPCGRVHGARRGRGYGIHPSQLRARPAPAQSREAGAVRVRPAFRGDEELPVRDQLLPDRDALHPLRHRGDLPLPGGDPARRLRHLRADRDDRLHRAADDRVRLRLEKGGPRVEVKRQKLGNAAGGDFRSRQLAARAMLRGELEGPELDEHVQNSLLLTTLDKLQSWTRGNSIFPATFGLACCAIEMMAIVGARVDVARFGSEALRASPRQADLMIISGRVSIKMAPVVRRLYDQMLEPKWTIG